MRLKIFFKENGKKITDGWFQFVCETYQSEASIFFSNKKNFFANPVGNTIKIALTSLFDELVSEDDSDIKKIRSVIDPIVRIRAVQNFSASESVSFILFPKKFARKEFEKETSHENIKDLLAIESKIDKFLLVAFDAYAECREKLNKIKANEIKKGTYRAFERAGLLCKDNTTLAERELGGI